MRLPPEITNEAARLRRLDDLMILDTEAEAVLDSFTEIAAAFTGRPISLISLVDKGRQWWKSAVGLPQGAHTARDISFCAHAIAGEGLFEVEDALRDERFFDNPIVTGDPHVIHYAGMPLVMPGGERIGTLCVIDNKPGRLDESGRALLEKLAKMVVRVLLLREHDRNLQSRVETQHALRASQERLRTIVDTIPQIVWTTDPDGSVRFLNQRWFEFVGDAAAAPGASWLDALHPQDRGPLLAVWANSLAHASVFECEARLRHRSGEYRWVLARALPLKDDQGQVLQWLGTCTDLEEQKRNETRLADADRRKDEFLAMLGHELRNPLAPIATGARLLMLASGRPETVLSTAEMILRQTNHLTSLVNDLLDVSRVTRGAVQLHTKVVDLRDIAHDAVEQVMPEVRSRGQQLEEKLPDGPIHVHGDPVRLTQILGNLLNNAAKYTPAWGHIQLRLEHDDGQARVTVTDTGQGIAPQLLPYVFDLFTQANQTPQRRQGGLGLGLALVKSLVELHGGRVEAHSPGEGRGSVFQLWLPLTQQSGPADARPVEKVEEAPGRKLRVAVVDDNLDAARSVADLLQAQGHEVAVDTNPFEALARASARPADVYVLDIGLPGMDGYELARQLRSQPQTAQATYVALTGYGQAQDLANAKEAGFHHHLLKPMDAQRMTALLAQVHPV